MNSNNKVLPFNNDISNIIRDYYGITLSFINKLKNKLKIYENIPDTTILLLDIFVKEYYKCVDIEGIFTSKEKVINYIINKELVVYLKNFNKNKIFEDLKKIDNIYELIPIEWININKPVYIHMDYYYSSIPLNIYKEPRIYLTQLDIHDLDDYFEVNIDKIYPLDKSIIDI